MKTLVIFDCDGVLVDSEQLASQALVECLDELCIRMTVGEAIERFKGRKTADCLSEIESTFGCSLPSEFETTFRQRMSRFFESRLVAIEGVEEVLRSVSHLKCVASNGPLEKTKRNLEIAGLLHYFGENIFSAYTIQKWKPEPDLFLHACKQMGAKAGDCVVVEDSESGVQAALDGGFKVLAFGLQSNHSDVRSFHHMSELPDLLESILPVI